MQVFAVELVISHIGAALQAVLVHLSCYPIDNILRCAHPECIVINLYRFQVGSNEGVEFKQKIVNFKDLLDIALSQIVFFLDGCCYEIHGLLFF